jgi:hypothetical protein
MGMRRLVQTGLVVALAAGFMALPALAETGSVATQTALATESIEVGGRTVTAYTVTVTGEDGAPAKGVVMLTEQGRNLAGAALDASGTAKIRADGLTGNHNLSAVYSGDSVHAASQSEVVPVSAVTIPADGFALAINPSSVTLATPGDSTGQTGSSPNVIATITPGSSFTGFVELSCAGPPVSSGSSTDSALPVGVTCVFTPENLQITSSTKAFTSSFSVQSTAPAGAGSGGAMNRGPKGPGTGAPLMLAILLPGIAGLGWLGRKRKLFSRVALLAMVGAIAVLGTAACNPRYKYLHHPPTSNGGTPAGDYTLTIWAQTSNGVSAAEQFTTMPLTIK